MAISVPFECGAEEAELTLEKRLEALECGNIRFQPVDYGVRLCAETADGETFLLTLYLRQTDSRPIQAVPSNILQSAALKIVLYKAAYIFLHRYK